MYKYILNGLVATSVHYIVLSFNLEILKIPSAGLSNFIASFFGIGMSFLGNKFYVFKPRNGTIKKQMITFTTMYALIAILHGSVLLLWTDMFLLDYQVGFILATSLQLVLSYYGNKELVFKK